MEIAIPLVALGSFYIWSNQQDTTAAPQENYENMGTNLNDLPNTTVPSVNYPTSDTIRAFSEEEAMYSDPYETKKYANPNAHTDKYFNVPPMSLETERVSYSLTGNQIDPTNFNHNNMQPFFGAKIRGMTTSSEMNQSVLDNYVGSGSQYVQKQEIAPMFKPEEHVQWSHGMPSTSDFVQDRMSMNVGQKVSNIKPFEEIREAPKEIKREDWMPKTVDELRIANKPKMTYSLDGHQGPSVSIQKNRGIQAPVEKNLPERYYDLGADRWFTTTGIEKGQTVRSVEVDKPVNRATTTVEYGGIARGQVEAAYVPGEYEESHRNVLGQYQMGAAQRVGAKVNDYGREGTVLDANNRTANDQPSDFFGIVGGAIGAVVSPLVDILRPSRKENVIANLRQFENVKGPAASYTYNPNDKAPTTMRETMEGALATYAVVQPHNFGGGAYEVSPQTPVENQRATTNKEYGGIAGAGYNVAPASQEADYRQRMNPYKEATTYNRIHGGNTNVFNNQVNLSGISKLEKDRVNGRDIMPTYSQQYTPSAQIIGRESNVYEPMMENNRNSPDLLAAFKNNPYTQRQIIN